MAIHRSRKSLPERFTLAEASKTMCSCACHFYADLEIGREDCSSTAKDYCLQEVLHEIQTYANDDVA